MKLNNNEQTKLQSQWLKTAHILIPMHVYITLAGALLQHILIRHPAGTGFTLWNDLTLHHRRERAEDASLLLRFLLRSQRSGKGLNLHITSRRHRVQGNVNLMSRGDVYPPWRGDISRETDTTVQVRSGKDPD